MRSTSDFVELRPVWTPGRKVWARLAALAGVILIALQLPGDGTGVLGEWLPRLVLVAVGLAVLWAVWQLVLVRQPELRLGVDRPHARRGEEIRVRWSLAGELHRVQTLRLTLETRRYRTPGNERRFSRAAVAIAGFDLLDSRELGTFERPDADEGEVSFQVSEDARRTHVSPRTWVGVLIVARVALAGSPDMLREYEIKVRRNAA